MNLLVASGESESGSGVPGRSARREAKRLRERRLRVAGERSGLVRIFFGVSAAEKRLVAMERDWVTGARGEEMLAEHLARKCPGTALLHDRRMPSSRANIDHIAVAPSGVYVIDAKRYKWKIEVRKPLFGDAKLVIAGRDRTELIHGLQKQVGVVKTDIAASGRGL